MTTHDQLTSARVIDVLYRESDKLYYELARDCGLSETAYWIMYAFEVSGGSVTQGQIASDFSYSKQTVNSALKTLEARGLVALAPSADDRRSKLVALTAAGRAFADERIRPAVAAEDRAFTSLAPAERADLVRLVRAYASAIAAEVARLRSERGQQ